jgi:hypothetical protein
MSLIESYRSGTADRELPIDAFDRSFRRFCLTDPTQLHKLQFLENDFQYQNGPDRSSNRRTMI